MGYKEKGKLRGDWGNVSLPVSDERKYSSGKKSSDISLATHSRCNLGPPFPSPVDINTIKCETLHRGELALLFTSTVYHGYMPTEVVMDLSSLELPKDIKTLIFSGTILAYSYDNFS